MKKEVYDITGMSCSACSSHVEKCVSKLEGVNSLTVNLLTNSMQIEYEESALSKDEIIDAVTKAGYGASLRGDEAFVQKADKQAAREEQKRKREQEDRSMRNRLIWSVAFLIPLMYVSMGHMLYSALSLELPYITRNYLHGNANAVTMAFTQLLLLIPILLLNRKYFTKGFSTLWRRSPNMDSLIAVGAGAAVLYGIYAIYRIGYGLGHGNLDLVTQYSHDLYFESAGMILTLVTIGKYLEHRSKSKTSEAITKLMDLTPKTVTVLKDGREEVIDAQELRAGDIFLLKPGEAAAVDGIIVSGTSSFDESAITGESLPVAKKQGDSIVSATINLNGVVQARASKVGEDTTIAQMIRLVEEASASKAPIAKLADKVAGVFVPVVIGIALLTFIVWLFAGAAFEFAMSCGIAVLVISCPCALGLATPVAIMVGTGAGAEHGVLIKSGEALQAFHQIDTVVLDKTGTITEGKPRVTDVKVFGMEEQVFVTIAASLERSSEHPLAAAIVEYAKQKQYTPVSVENFEAIFGKGIRGSVQGTDYIAGNEAFLLKEGVVLNPEQKQMITTLAKQGKTPMLFARTQEKGMELLGMIAVADVVKPTSKEAVELLHKENISVIMLTGDNEITANAIKEQVLIDEVIAGVLPTGKEAEIKALKKTGKQVAMVGDGINDAPALAAADVGVAIGAGTDIAIESADIVLMRNDLRDVSGAIHLSRAVIRNIKQNLFWAFFYNCIGIPLAAGVLYPVFALKLSPMFGAFAMSLSSVCVVSNALRLKGLRWYKNNGDVKEDVAEPEKLEESEVTMMTKTITIEGMSCGHCTARVETALKALDGVQEVIMSLEDKTAIVSAEEKVSEDMMKGAVTEAGYDVVSIA